MGTKILRTVLRIIIWTVVAIVGLLLLAVVALYIPAVQNWAKDFAIGKVEQSTGMKIEVATLRLRPPLRLELGGVTAIEASGDTLATLGHAGVEVKLLPLLSGRAELTGADIRDVFYRMGTPDSAMYLTLRADTLDIGNTIYNFKRSAIDAEGMLLLAGADVDLMMNDSVPTPPDTAATSPMDLLIKAREIELRRIDFRMRMMPVIDTLAAFIPTARLEQGLVDMATQRIKTRALTVDSITAAYLFPKTEPSDTTDTSDEPETASKPWTVTADRVNLTARRARYGLAGARPLPGLDMDYIEVTDVAIEVDSLYNRQTAVRVPLRRLLARERSGLRLNASGLFEMDSAAMRATGFRISTGRSLVTLDALMGMGDLLKDPSLPLALAALAEIAPADIATAFPAFAPMIDPLGPTPMRLTARIDGTTGRLAIDTLAAALPSVAHIKASGAVSNPFDFNRMTGRVRLDGAILGGADRLKSVFLDPATARQINIPPMTLRGDVDYSPGKVDGTLAAVTGAGRLGLDARWTMRAEGYDASLTTEQFPVQAFMPSLGLADATLSAKVRGHGYNPLRPTTQIEADIAVDAITLNSRRLSDITLSALLTDGQAQGELVSSNADAELDADFTATLSPEGYQWNLTGSIYDLDLHALGLSETPMGGSLDLATEGSMSSDMKRIDARLNVADLAWNMGTDRFTADTVKIALDADSTTRASILSDDLTLRADAPVPLMTLVADMSRISPVIDSCMARKRVDVKELQRTLPPLRASLEAGPSNPVATYLANSAKTTWDSIALTLSNDTVLNLAARATGVAVGTNRLDTVTFDANQKGKYLVFRAALDERPGTLDNFAHVNLTGFVADDKISMLLRQSNIKGEQGFHIGMNATAADSAITVRFVPRKPVIAYKPWSINPDNYVSYNFASRFISADLRLEGDNSRLHLYTLNETPEADQEDIALQIDSIHLQDWFSISPFAPPIKGDLGADLRFHIAKEQITGKGTASLTDLYYGRDRVGTFGLDLDIENTRGNILTADIGLMVDSMKVMTARGSLNDTTRSEPFLLDFNMIRFPLAVANPFLPKEYARLSGTLSGHMDITGTMAEPVFNGKITFDSSAVRVGMLGQTFTFAPDSIPVDSNIVNFDRFRILGANDNPLLISGKVDMRRLADPAFDLAMTARDMQIVNSSRPRGADVYGRAFIDLDAKVRGDMQFVNVDAALALLAGTNVTYIMTDAENRIASQSTGDMVQFVVFADSGRTVAPDSVAPSMNMNVNATLDIEEGSTITVDLSSDSKNKVQIQGQGKLTYNQNPMNDGRLTGRFTINSGFVRYTPPLMSEKLFNFREDSYVAFNGDIMNPILDIHANDILRANVTQSGQNSRLVNFDVALGVTGTLENMNVKFDLSTNDDITVQNELQSMSPEQRANQAMNLLLYNTYTGSGTRATANLSGNPLYSFLSSQLNSWMANNIKGVDITFGIDQYDKTTDGSTSTTTSYSYRISKNLFNDRFKIIVGGNYSTDANADENFSQNLINDISFEYMLNRSGSMYVRIFRHTGYESILEGEITQTGVGFVMRRKLNSLRDLFRFIPGVKPKEQPLPEPPAEPAAD